MTKEAAEMTFTKPRPRNGCWISDGKIDAKAFGKGFDCFAEDAECDLGPRCGPIDFR